MKRQVKKETPALDGGRGVSGLLGTYILNYVARNPILYGTVRCGREGRHSHHEM